MRSQFVLVVVCSFAALGCCAISGCGEDGGEFDVVSISGKITCDGKALGAGVGVQFIPVLAEGAIGEDGRKLSELGKSATAVVQEDGSFTLSTYGDGDGAVVGRHRIVILPATDESDEEDPDPDDGGPADNDDEDNENEEGTPLPCSAPSDLFVEITADTSVVNIEMSNGGKVTTE